MGKRKGYRFPQGINGLNKFLNPHLHPHPQTNPSDFNRNRYFDGLYNEVESDMYSETDPLGQYTGVTKDGFMPLQDADDL